MISFKLNCSFPREFYNLQASLHGILLCGLRRKVADLTFLYDLLNSNIDSPDSFSMAGLDVGNHCLRKNNLSHVPLCYNNYSFVSFLYTHTHTKHGVIIKFLIWSVHYVTCLPVL